MHVVYGEGVEVTVVLEARSAQESDQLVRMRDYERKQQLIMSVVVAHKVLNWVCDVFAIVVNVVIGDYLL